MKYKISKMEFYGRKFKWFRLFRVAFVQMSFNLLYNLIDLDRTVFDEPSNMCLEFTILISTGQYLTSLRICVSNLRYNLIHLDRTVFESLWMICVSNYLIDLDSINQRVDMQKIITGANATKNHFCVLQISTSLVKPLIGS